MAAIAAVSPTLVYSSRTVNAEIAVAAFSLLFLVAFLRIGLADNGPDGSRRWAFVAGIALAAMYACGASSLSVMIALAIGLVVAVIGDSKRLGPVHASLREFRETGGVGAWFLIGAVVTLLFAFTRSFSDFRALSGLGTTVADWGRLLSTTSSNTPTQFFLLAILLYEIVPVVFSIVAASRSNQTRPGELSWTFFGAWFIAALLIFSFSSGAAPAHTVHIALPLVLLGGGELGAIIAQLSPRALLRGQSGLLLLILVGLVIALLSWLVLLGRISGAADQQSAVFQAIAAFLIAVVPLGFAAYLILREEALRGIVSRFGFILLLAASVILVAYTVRSSVLLSFERASQGTEMLAQSTSTPAVNAVVKRITNLSRDATVYNGSAKDPEGGHDLSIAIDKRVEWPYRWYLREFPNVTVAAAGQANQQSADVVIAPDDTDMAAAGYSPTTYYTLNRTPPTYLAPKFGVILKDIVFPSHWERGVRYLLYRDIETPAAPDSIVVGLTSKLSGMITPNQGPFGLYSNSGAGSLPGQFNQPRGIAASFDNDQIYVVDMGNDRVEQFAWDGTFIAQFGGQTDQAPLLTLTDQGLGPTGIAVGPDGLIYVCDTWAHRILVLDQKGATVRTWGSFANLNKSADPTLDPGKFFGPRAITFLNDEIYVVDTGNDRVQVFDMQGNFKRAFGGSGTGNGQLMEPVGIAAGADGHIYVADSANARISVFTPDGASVAEWPVDAWAGRAYYEPYLAFGGDGNLYATSSETGSIEVYSTTGQHLDSITDVGGVALSQPVGIGNDADGNLLITDKGLNAVFKYTPEVAENPITAPSSPTESATPVAASPVASPVASPIASPIASPAASPKSTP
jgi:DNA-binding beta-propeller fold protein YncE